MLKDYEFKTELIGRPFREGRAEGRVEALLGFLEAREIKVSEAARERITGTTDIAVLDAMLRKAAHVERVEDLFGE
ncbi:hypothetical protein [Nocardiopsis sp. NPDC006832]|uniref:hypothetical protein n=1 Tax=Nocardiopsis sp. NPDC006832 TaxID=3157188 RepID=UPI0033DB546E